MTSFDRNRNKLYSTANFSKYFHMFQYAYLNGRIYIYKYWNKISFIMLLYRLLFLTGAMHSLTAKLLRPICIKSPLQKAWSILQNKSVLKQFLKNVLLSSMWDGCFCIFLNSFSVKILWGVLFSNPPLNTIYDVRSSE